jgi:hypothetical protein
VLSRNHTYAWNSNLVFGGAITVRCLLLSLT